MADPATPQALIHRYFDLAAQPGIDAYADIQDAGNAYNASVDITGGAAPGALRLVFHFEFGAGGHIRVLTIRP